MKGFLEELACWILAALATSAVLFILFLAASPALQKGKEVKEGVLIAAAKASVSFEERKDRVKDSIPE